MCYNIKSGKTRSRQKTVRRIFMETTKFMTSLLTFYIKGEIKADANFLKLKMPNTLLTLIPLGSEKSNIPINQIADAGTGFKLIFKHFLAGLIELIAGFVMFGNVFLLGLILVLVGACTIINSFQTTLTISTTSGTDYVLNFLVFEKSAAERAAESIVAMIASRMDDTNTRMQTERQMAQNERLNEDLINAINRKG